MTSSPETLPDESPLPPPSKHSVLRELERSFAIFLLLLSIVAIIGVPIYLKASGGHPIPAERMAQQIVQAVNAFYAELSIVPVAPKNSEKNDPAFSTDSEEGKKVLAALSGLDSPENPGNIKFVTFPEARDKKNGAVYNSSGTKIEGLYDRWGNPYFIVLDSHYDERLDFTVNGKSIALNGRRCAVYSAGPDHKTGTADDIKTWSDR